MEVDISEDRKEIMEIPSVMDANKKDYGA